ncbi:MAG: hypothetical protein KatS3mg114_0299 [Planctomycetaceae bacterium]|nr:MAG: hypothetical protein KatS3mg114_0299 [Planctomycetaceae bacterium]
MPHGARASYHSLTPRFLRHTQQAALSESWFASAWRCSRAAAAAQTHLRSKLPRMSAKFQRRGTTFRWMIVLGITVGLLIGISRFGWSAADPYTNFELPVLSEDDDWWPGVMHTSGDDPQYPTSAIVTNLIHVPAQSPRITRRWRGLLMNKGEGQYQVHAYFQGELQLQLGHAITWQTQREQPGWSSSPPFVLNFGEHALHVQHVGAELKLFWSSEEFPLEPLPHHILFHAREESPGFLAAVGYKQIMAAGCLRCHEMRTASVRLKQVVAEYAGPSLRKLVLPPDEQLWIRRLTANGEKTAEVGHRMPHFGFKPEQAAAIVKALQHAAEHPQLPRFTLKNIKPDDIERGTQAILSLGCLACHHWQGLGNRALTAGPPLDGLVSRRTVEWLGEWLQHPERLQPQARMPVFSLTERERQQIVAALLASPGAPPPERAALDLAAASSEEFHTGRQLVRQARCARCHELPAALTTEPPPPAAPAWEEVSQRLLLSPREWVGCLSAHPDEQTFRPTYPQVDASAIRAACASFAQYTPRWLEVRGCVNCHDRHGRQGLSRLARVLLERMPAWNGQTQTLIPPSLTAVGEKLLEEPLRRALRGDQPPRLTWLRVRMPRFDHSAEVAEQLFNELTEEDRIPTPAPPTYLDLPQHDLPTSQEETLLLGRELAGARGFSCIACHSLRDYVPRQVALGTRGSDLYLLGQRMRPAYFLRWTRAPLRIVPGIEMPSYQRPHPEFYDGRLDLQIAALWAALNDPQFTAPTNPVAVEQLLVVSPNGAPRLVRDVFTRPEPVTKSKPSASSGRYVPHALAIGWGNQHSVLFDLDRGAVSAWGVGDFARQRTEGKSWFWDLAGIPVAVFAEQSELWCQGAAEPLPTPVVPVNCQPLADLWQDQEVHVHYRCERKLSEQEAKRSETDHASHADQQSHREPLAAVHEVWFPLTDHAEPAVTGWERVLLLRPHDKLRDYAWYWQPSVQQLHGSASIWVSRRAAGQDEEIRVAGPLTAATRQHLWSAGAGEFTRWSGERTPLMRVRLEQPQQDEVWYVLRLRYLSTLRVPSGEYPARPVSKASRASLTTVPGWRGLRLPLDTSIMPTALAFSPAGELIFTSLKGHIWLARDTDHDGLEDSLHLFAEGLAAPFGLRVLSEEEKRTLAAQLARRVPQAQLPPEAGQGLGVLVAHKPAVLWLQDVNHDQRADWAVVIATGWGYTDDYHDWTTGIARDTQGWYYVGTGSDYAQKQRPREAWQWRGRILRFNLQGTVEEFASALRYPMGLAMWRHDLLVCSDQQGVQNCFNELNVVLRGKQYGVPALGDTHLGPPVPAAVQIPHPWTRSVNGLEVWPEQPDHPFAGHILGAEYNERGLVRMTLEQVAGEWQGAVFPFSRFPTTEETFLGPICLAFDPRGRLYVGSMHDSGWLGGLNTGEIVRLEPTGELPNGLRTMRALPDGFELEFLAPLDPQQATQPEQYSLRGYTRQWQGDYATPDSGLHQPSIHRVTLDETRRRVRLHVQGLKPGHVYDIQVHLVAPQPLWPARGHYTLHRVPAAPGTAAHAP